MKKTQDYCKPKIVEKVPQQRKFNAQTKRKFKVKIVKQGKCLPINHKKIKFKIALMSKNSQTGNFQCKVIKAYIIECEVKHFSSHIKNDG